MKKLFGRHQKVKDGQYQLQYWYSEDRLYEVVESQAFYRRFDTKKELLEFAKKNNIKLENQDD